MNNNVSNESSSVIRTSVESNIPNNVVTESSCTSVESNSTSTPDSIPIVRTTTSPSATAGTDPFSERMRPRTYSAQRHLIGETDFTKKLYSDFREGNQPSTPIEQQSNFIDAQRQFLRKLEQTKLTYCNVCKERWFDTNINNGRCKNCDKFSFVNDMDPFPGTCTYPFHLPKLTMIEEMLIAKAHVIMAVYRLRQSGTVVYRGNVLNVQQDNDNLLKSILNSNDFLPRKISDLPIIYLRKNRSEDPMDFKDFKVNRNSIKLWLEFLVQHNPLYKDNRINKDFLNELPENGSVLNSLTIENEAEILTNEENNSNDPQQECKQQLGPEQGGATGTTSLVDTDFLGQNTNNNLEIEDERIEKILRTHVEGTRDNPISWPTQSLWLNDYSQPFLQCMAFPTLFPYGKGDWFNRERNVEVSLTDSNKHLLKYAVRNTISDTDNLEPEYIYPFAEHERWANWAQNINERHRINDQRNIYLKKNPEDANLTENDLRNLVRDNGEEFKKLTNRMQTFNANIVGSNAYFWNKKKELEALMDQEGMCTMWFTLSAADNHWVDLHRLLYGKGAYLPDISDPIKNVRWKNKMCQKFPHIVDTYFCKRVDFIMETIFSKLGISAKWWWKRIEYQKRGTAHAHGCFRLVCDPGLTEAAKKVLEGRISEMLMNQFQGWELVQTGVSHVGFSETSIHSDEWEKTFSKEKPKSWNDSVCTEHALNVEYGILQEKIITNFQDYFLTTINGQCPVDSTKEKRDPTTLFNYSTANTLHPCSLDPKQFFNISNGFNSALVRRELYQPAVNVVERHNCNGYCFRKNKKRKKQVEQTPPRVLNNMTVGIGRKKKKTKITFKRKITVVLIFRNH